MDPDMEIAFQRPPYLRVYKSGRFERLLSPTADEIPAGVDPNTGIASKDVMIDLETGVSARMYLPSLLDNSLSIKLPVVVYYHGGGFTFGSTFSRRSHEYLSSIVAQARVLVVSVEYRLAPEHPLPTAHDDSWVAFKWVMSHAEGSGTDEWLNKYGDFERAFLAGDSAGANIAHHMAMRASEHGLHGGVRITGVALLFPYFWGAEKLPSEMERGRLVDPVTAEAQWPYLCPGTSGHDDPLINPLAESAPSLAKLGCKSVLVFVAERDILRDRARKYYERLKTSGWEGSAELVETEGEDHCFHHTKLESEKAVALLQRLVAFFNQGDHSQLPPTLRMDPDMEIAFQRLPHLRVYKSGRIERLLSPTADEIPAGVDPNTGIASKDVMIDMETGVSARMYLPSLLNNSPSIKLPVIVHYHGGGFTFGSTFSRPSHEYLSSIVAQARVLAVSVEYRLAPEHPLPTAHDDSWVAFKWVMSHAEGNGTDEWLNKYGDFERVFLAGDSAGANIAHHMAMRAGEHGLHGGVRINGAALLFPYFWGAEKLPSEMERGRLVDPVTADAQWPYLCPGTSGHDDPLINPLAESAPSLAKLGCKSVLVFVAERDTLRDRARKYYESLKTSGWEGAAELVEQEGEDHCFHWFKRESEKAVALMQLLAAFFNQA